MSHPFQNREFIFTQPDGSEFHVRGWGDQYRARFKTLDGHIVSRNPETGFYEFAEPQAGMVLETLPSLDLALQPSSGNALDRNTRWRERRREAFAQAKSEAEAPPQRQTIGKYVGLCLPIRFRDISTKITQEEIDEFCNKPSYSGYKNNGSVRDFFIDNSNGKCDYTTVVAPLYTSKKDRSYYIDPKIDFGVRAEELITEALSFHKGKGFDFSRLTTDSQNYVYAVNAFYAGEIVNNWSEGLWPHAHHLSTPVQLATGVTAHDYQITALGDKLEIGTYCHENGHMLCDFPDLYDYDSDSAGIGDYCLMCGGNNADPRNPIQVCGYLKFCAGWAGSVTKAQAGTDITLASLGNHLLIHRKSATEYVLIENRAKASRDAALPDAGIAIWHVDERGDNRHQQDDPVEHYECALIQADGKKDLEHNRNQGGPGDLYSGGAKFSGKWWDRTSIGFAFECAGKPGPTMTVKIRKA